MKTCGMCRQQKPLSEFHKDRGKRGGHSARCKVCACEAGKKWARDNPERVRAVNAAWRAANREHAVQRNRARNYGTDGVEMFAAQQGRCAICGVDLAALPTKHRHIDHEHSTGRVRGWLCHWCNLGIGKFKDDPSRLRAAADYLEKGKK